MESKGVSVVVLQLGKTDLTSTAGWVIRSELAALAKMERSLLVERTKAGLARAAAEGKRLDDPARRRRVSVSRSRNEPPVAQASAAWRESSASPGPLREKSCGPGAEGSP